MLDEEKALQRIRNMSYDERLRIMKESLDAAHIKYTETPGSGKIIFNGLPAELKRDLTRREREALTSISGGSISP